MKAFVRHDGIYHADGPNIKAGAGVPPSVGRPRCPAKRRDGRTAPGSSSATSSDRLFLDGVLASIARLCFAGTPIINLWTRKRKGFTIER